MIACPCNHTYFLFSMFIWPNGPSTRPDKSNNLTFQSAYILWPQGTPNLMDSLHEILLINGPTLWYVYIYTIGTSAVVAIAVITVTASRSWSATRRLSGASAVISIQHFCAAPHFYSWFSSLFPIQFNSHGLKNWCGSYFSHTPGSPLLVRVFWRGKPEEWNCGIFRNSINWNYFWQKYIIFR